MRKRLIPVAILVMVGCALFVSRMKGQEGLDSLIVCHETQKLLFENAFVRVIDDVIPPGISEPRHRHPHGVVIALEDADTEVHVYPDGKAARRHTQKGSVSWNEALVHGVKNMGATATHFVRIDLK